MYTLVPEPNVSVTVFQNAMMIVGQPLILECIVTTVRGINSQVDIVWSNSINDTKRDNVSEYMENSNSVLFRDYLIISQLTTDNNNVTYECKVIINAKPIIEANNTFILHVNGKHPSLLYTTLITYACVLCSFRF